MRRLIGLLLVSAAGCSGFEPPSSEQLRTLGLRASPTAAPHSRIRFRMSVDSPWLAGEFEGVVVAQRGGVRAQLFGDLGPKAIDLVARPGRVVGYFPQLHEGIDCSLPGEAAPHPLLFLGASLLEECSELTEDRVLGIREGDGGCWLLLKSPIEGLEIVAFESCDRERSRRRFRWMQGVAWELERIGADERKITASGTTIRVKILERDSEPPKNPGILELTLPPDVRIVLGSRK